MKKVIIFSILFSLLAGNAFAQLTFSGEAYAGAQYKRDFNGDDSADVYNRIKGGPYFDFGASLVKENYGMKLSTIYQTTSDLQLADAFSLNGLYGWVNFLDNSIRLTMGQISDAVWVSSLDVDHEFYFDDITGFRVEYKTPLPGLSIGAAFPAKDYDGEKFAKKIIFGASYIHPMFNTVFAYDMGNNAQLIYGFNFTGVDQLTSAGFQIKASNLATWDNPLVGGVVQVNEKVGYRVIRPLTLTLLAGQTFYGDKDTDVTLFFTPGIAYRIIPALTACLDVEIFSENYFESQVITINPYLEYSLKGGALFYIEYELALAKYKKDSYHAFGFGIDIRAF